MNTIVTLYNESGAPMQFGVPLDENSPLFFGCLIAAIGLVYLFCSQKFGERSVVGNDDYVYQLTPRQLATPEEYSKGFLIYLSTMVSAVVILSLIGPKNLHALGLPVGQDVSYAVVPLAVAFVLISVLPNVPMLQEIERRLRQYAHERAYIPAGARATADRLSAADFEFSSYAGSLQTRDLRGVEQTDLIQPRRSLEHDWARLSCLVYEEKSRRLSGTIGPLDAGLLQDYKRDLELIEARTKSMEVEVATYRAEKARNPAYTNDALHQTIRNSLHKLYILLGCAVRLKKQPHDDINLALRAFGFKLDQPPVRVDNRDLLMVGMVVMAASVLLLGFAAVEAAHLRLWVVSDVFPQTWYQPFTDTIEAVIIYGAGILMADFVRKRRIRRGSWFSSNGLFKWPSTANYVRIAFVSGLAGYAGSILWGLAFGGITADQLKLTAPFILLPAATGAFYVYHLDNIELNMRPSRLRELGWQTIVTAICGLIAASASFAVLFGDVSLVADQILLKAAISAVVGFSLAWYIPKAAAAAKERSDPLTLARKERIGLLEAAALRRFGHTTPAADWLEQSHGALDGRSPRSAAADVEGYEKAISLLQGPQAVIAPYASNG
jgi:hypothetical protein